MLLSIYLMAFIGVRVSGKVRTAADWFIFRRVMIGGRPGRGEHS